MDPQQKISAFKQISFSKFLQEDELWYLLATCETVSLETGQILFEENSFKESMFIVLCGTLEVYKQYKHIAFRGVGDFFGEMSLLEPKPRSTSIRATTDAVLLEIDRDIFDNLIGSNPKIIWDISKTLTQRERENLDSIDSGYRELKRSEEKYRHIVNLVSDLIIQVNPNGAIEFVNESARLLGYEVKELTGKPFAEIYDGQLDDKRKRHVLTRRTGLRAPTDMEFSLKVDPLSSLHGLMPSMSFMVSASGMWSVPQEMVLEKDSQKEFLGTLLIARTEKMDLQM
ncbi:MAG: cyclic nucleotide-binding domain-containing protein [Nitrospina sp.]|jgi:PAS domain-containing protein|nr:cyclic nucleotide-binding domain-containing protein [Nitrospina sp.]